MSKVCSLRDFPPPAELIIRLDSLQSVDYLTLLAMVRLIPRHSLHLFRYLYTVWIYV